VGAGTILGGVLSTAPGERRLHRTGCATGSIKGTLVDLRWQRTLRAERRYEGMDITGLTGVTDAQRSALLAVGAVDHQDPAAMLQRSAL